MRYVARGSDDTQPAIVAVLVGVSAYATLQLPVSRWVEVHRRRLSYRQGSCKLEGFARRSRGEPSIIFAERDLENTAAGATYLPGL